MSEQGLPDGVERVGVSLDVRPMPMGDFVRVSDLPKIIDQARQEERERGLSDEAIKAARAAETRWHRADTPDTEAISLVEYVLRAALDTLKEETTPDPLVEQRDALRRLCSRDSTNYAQKERLEHRAELKRIEKELEARNA